MNQDVAIALCTALGYISEIIFTLLFFRQVAKEKKHSAFSFIPVLLIGTIAVTLSYFFSNIYINVAFTVAINILLAITCFEMKKFVAVLYAVFLTTISVITENLAYYFLETFTNNSLDFEQNPSSLFMCAFVMKLFYFIVLMVISRFVKSKSDSGKVPLSFIIYPIAILFAEIINAVEFWFNKKTSDTFNIIVNVFLIISVIILFFTYQHSVEKEAELIKAQNELDKAETNQRYLDILERQNENLRMYAHDTKNHLATIKNLVNSPQVDEYINEMEQNLKHYSNVAHCGNRTLDVIINKYITECDINSVKFDYDLKLSNFSFVKDYDLVTIFGNILDNALTSAKNSNEKSISLAVTKRNKYDVIIVTNSCDTPPKSENNNLVSIKSGATHGMGMKNLKRTVADYGGDFEWQYSNDKNTFTLTVMLKNE